MPKKKQTDSLQAMEALLNLSLQEGSRLYAYAKRELIDDPENSKNPDAKPLKEVVAVLQQIRELRKCECANELIVTFTGDGKVWSE